MHELSSLSRRNFIAHVTALGAAGLLGGSKLDFPTDTKEAAGLRLDQMSADDFGRYLGQTFRIERETGEPIDAQLIRVQPHNTSRSILSGQRPSFSLVFRSSQELPHQTYAIEHAELGRFDLFLGAVGKPSAEGRLEAIFG